MATTYHNALTAAGFTKVHTLPRISSLWTKGAAEVNVSEDGSGFWADDADACGNTAASLDSYLTVAA